MAHQSKGYKKFVATAATATLVASAIAPVASAASFKDVSKDYQAAVNYLVENGIAKGTTETTFGTNLNITRGDAAVMIANAVNLDTTNAPSAGFTDVNTRVAGAVNAIVAAGIANGKTETKFDPAANITRAEMAKMLANAFELTAKENANFKDVNKNWIGYVSALKENGITLGKTETTFAPDANLTRGEFALFMFRAKDLTPVAGEAELVKAINNTHVEVTFKEAVTDLAAIDFKIEGLDITQKVVKQTDAKTVVLTTAPQTAGKLYTVKAGDKTLGTFAGVSAVIPTGIKVSTPSLQGVIGKDVTVTAEVTVPDGQTKAGIPVTFNIVNNSATNEKLEAVAYTNDKGVASYTYTRYYSSEDNVAAYATNKSSVVSSGKVYWASAIQLAVEEITTGNDLANETKKSYKVKGARNTTYYIAIKENLNVAPDKLTDVMVQNHGTQNFITPYEMSTGATNYATVTTNNNGEGAFTIYGSNLEATPIVYLPSSVNSKAAYSPLALQAQAATVKFSRVDRLAVDIVGEGTADSAEYSSIPLAYDANSAGGRMYTATVTDKDGKVAPVGTVAYVTFKAANVSGDVYFTTGTKNFVKVTAGTAYPVTVGKDGKAQFRIAGKGATSYAKPTVFLNTAGSTTDVKLDTGDVQKDGDVTYFKTPIVTNAALKVTDQYGRVVTSLTAGQDAYFTYQSVDQNGFPYRPGNYTVTEGKTQIIYVQETLADGTIIFVPKEVKIDPITNNQYVLAFDVSSTFGNAVVKDANGVTLPVYQNLGNTKTYHVNSNAEGKAVVRITSQSADTVSVNVTGASNILPTQTASVSFVSTSQVPAAYTGAVQAFNVQNNTLTFAGKEPVALYGTNITYTTNNGAHILTDDQFTALLRNASGTVTLTRIVSGDQVRFDVVAVSSTGTKPVDETGSLTDQQIANVVAAQIVALPATNALTINDKAAVQAARTAYNGLSAVQKTLVADTTVAKLVAAEAKIAELEAANPVEFKITTADKSYANTIAQGLGIASINVAGTIASADRGKVSEVKISVLPLEEDQEVATVAVDDKGNFTYAVTGSSKHTSVQVQYVVDGETKTATLGLTDKGINK